MRMDRVRLCLSLVVVFGVLVAAPAAQANLTPLGGRVTATSTDVNWAASPSGASWTCPTASFSGSISVDGRRISGRLTFSGDAGRRSTCAITSAGGSVSTVFNCPGSVTLVVSSSAAGANASGTLVLDRDFSCLVNILAMGCTATVAGPQGPLTGWTFDQATQTLTLTIRGITASGCGVAGFNLTATFVFSPRITVS